MRPDMHKVIVERPRLGRRGALGFPRTTITKDYGRGFEDVPRCLGISVPHRSKELNENLAPLKRWLWGQVGRPWSKVYSELRQVVDPRSAVRAHILQHLYDYVEVNVEMRDGRPFTLSRWGREAPIERTTAWRHQLWVCPRTGLLRVAPEPRRKFRSIGRPIRFGDAELVEVDGVWWHVTLAPIPPVGMRETAYDVLLRSALDDPNLFDHRQDLQRTFKRANRYAVALREPGKRELRAIERALEAKKPRTRRCEKA